MKASPLCEAIVVPIANELRELIYREWDKQETRRSGLFYFCEKLEVPVPGHSGRSHIVLYDVYPNR